MICEFTSFHLSVKFYSTIPWAATDLSSSGFFVTRRWCCWTLSGEAARRSFELLLPFRDQFWKNKLPQDYIIGFNWLFTGVILLLSFLWFQTKLFATQSFTFKMLFTLMTALNYCNWVHQHVPFGALTSHQLITLHSRYWSVKSIQAAPRWDRCWPSQCFAKFGIHVPSKTVNLILLLNFCS